MSRAKGNMAEDEAVRYLHERGFVVLERNFYSRFGEIDIIATCKENVLHFIEVKSALEYSVAVENITPSKLKKIIATADVYMKKHGYDGSYFFDGVVITPDETVYLENITL